MRHPLVFLGIGLCLAGLAGCAGAPTGPDELQGAMPPLPDDFIPDAGGGGNFTFPMKLTRSGVTLDRSTMFGDPQAWRILPESGQAIHTTEAGTIHYRWTVPPHTFKDRSPLTYSATATSAAGQRLIFEILVSGQHLISDPNQPRMAEATAEGGQPASAERQIVFEPNDEKDRDAKATITVHLRFGPRVVYTYTYADAE